MAERKNRTIAKMAQSMLKGKGLPNKFWVDAINSTIYILNRSPTKVVRNKTPFEAWNKRKPVVNHLKVFWCIAYALVSHERDKFDEKGEKLIFIGCSNESKGYRLFNPKTNKLVVARDVVFDEMAAWSWDQKLTQVPITYEFLEPVANQEEQSQSSSSPTRSPASSSSSQESSDSPLRKMRSLREIYESCDVSFFSCEPTNFEEASKQKVWRKAMDEEIATIQKNKTWELVDLPEGKDVIGLKWVYNTKFKEDGSIHKHKASLKGLFSAARN